MKAGHKKYWKVAVAGLSRRLRLSQGYLGLRHPFCGARQTVMLTYHRVVERDRLHEVCSLPQIVTPLDEFEAQLEFLASHYHVLSMDEFAMAWQARRAMPLRTAVITFDDGWEDNYSVAFPVLKRRAIPATIFLSTGYIGTTQAFWQEQVLHLLQVCRLRVQSGEIKTSVLQEFPPSFKSAVLGNDPEGTAWRLIEDLKGADDNIRSKLLDALAGILDHPSFPNRANGFMTWDQVREMQAAGIGFGSHACTHRLLPGLSSREVSREVRESKKQMDDLLGVPTTTFAYPNGNYDAAVMAELKDAGYRLAATTRRGLNTVWTNPYELRRMNVNGRLFADSAGRFSEDLFAFRLAGLG
ncbi:MAG: polysaccharide deacetylase family protein [bacterium]